MGWGQPTTPSTWTGQADARIAQLEQRLERALDAYGALWHRHAALTKRARDVARDVDDRRDLPSPHELRTGQTREDVLTTYAAQAAGEGQQP